MADEGREGTEQNIQLVHVRSNDFREFHADGIVSRLDGQNVVLTCYINDPIITHEDMKLMGEGAVGATYQVTCSLICPRL